MDKLSGSSERNVGWTQQTLELLRSATASGPQFLPSPELNSTTFPHPHTAVSSTEAVVHPVRPSGSSSSGSGIRSTPEHSVAVEPTQQIFEVSPQAPINSQGTSLTCSSNTAAPTPPSPKVTSGHRQKRQREEDSNGARSELRQSVSQSSSDITMDALSQDDDDCAAERRALLERFGRLTQLHLGEDSSEDEDEGSVPSDVDGDAVVMDSETMQLFAEMRARNVEHNHALFGSFAVRQARRLLAHVEGLWSAVT
mmetsp:Transcript_32139/g.37066  ORF Transcript_32139/g.37066 Transcript_32139/m.37066 type:complete len:254 (-) Transcript_32139:109-870(-)